MKDKVTIVAVAIRVDVPDEFREKIYNDKRIYPDYMIISSPPPARHHTLMHPMFDLTNIKTNGSDQGFLTSEGQYVDREEAYKIALNSRQLLTEPTKRIKILFSEDLW